jgi:hypothetical protein
MEEPSNDTLLKRLLGPTGPEILCHECFERLDEYVELLMRGAAADDHIPGMRAHLAGCPACQEEFESLRALVDDSEARGED